MAAADTEARLTKLGLTPEQALAMWKARCYNEKLPDDISRIRELLENYSKVPPEEVEDLIYKIRDKAWSVYRYPCIGRFSFLSLRVLDDRRYRAALARLTAPGSTDALLDLACCFGQVVRQLAHDGVDSARLYGTDLRPEFIELGYELFRDRDTLKATFKAGDMLAADGDGGLAAALDGRVTIVHAAAFFHLFGWADQLTAATRVVRFLHRRDGDEALDPEKAPFIFGRQIGWATPEGGEIDPVGRGAHFLHGAASLQRLWDEVGARTGTRWRAEVEVLPDAPPVHLPGFPEGARYITFGVYQIA